MKEFLKNIANKYEISSAIDKLNINIEDIECKIGLLGEFGSGKSTLINSLIGKKVLPAMVKPTSKCIVEIIPKADIQEIEYYRANDDGFLSTISASEFSDIALGTTPGSAALLVPENESLKSGFNFIDTPGFTALDKADADIAYGVLPQLDGIVICVDANKGSLPKTVTDFIAKPHVKALFERIMIIVTFAATKSDAIGGIVQRIKNQMTDIAIATRKSNVENPVIAFDGDVALSERDDAGLQQLISTLRTAFYEKVRLLQQDREKSMLLEIAISMKSILEERAKMVNYDTPEFNAQEAELEKSLKVVEQEIKELDERLLSMEKKIEDKVKNIAMQFGPQFKQQKATGIREVFTQMATLINTEISALIKTHLEGFTMPNTLHWSTSMEDAFSSIERKVNVGKGLATAVITAVAAVATSGASTAATEAAAAAEGAAVGIGTREASKAMVKQGAKTAVEETVKKGAEEGVKKGVLAKLLPFIGETIKAINPAEWGGDIAESYLKESTIDNMLIHVPRNMALNIIESFKEEFNVQHIKPARKNITDKRESLSQIRSAKMKTMEERDAYKKQILEDIKAIQTRRE